MSTTLPRQRDVPAGNDRDRFAVELHSGDQMTREEFHRLYEQTPDGFKAELIGGVVYVASPVSRQHAAATNLFNTALGVYAARTPGVEPLDNGTVLFDDDSEPQPDVSLRVRPEFGGQSGTTPAGDYVIGAPELVIEAAYSSKSIDLHAKRIDYARYGVKEYLVWNVKDGTFAWFDLAENMERELPADGVVRSLVFPGLWINAQAVRDENHKLLLQTLEAGLATSEHAAFVQRLAAVQRP